MMKTLRERATWTQVELAVASGVSTRSVHSIEVVGLASVSRRIGEKIVDALSERLLALGKIERPLTYEELLEEEEEEEPTLLSDIA